MFLNKYLAMTSLFGKTSLMKKQAVFENLPESKTIILTILSKCEEPIDIQDK